MRKVEEKCLCGRRGGNILYYFPLGNGRFIKIWAHGKCVRLKPEQVRAIQNYLKQCGR